MADSNIFINPPIAPRPPIDETAPPKAKYAVAPTVSVAEIGEMLRDPDSVTLPQLLDVIARLGSDFQALSQVIVRIKTASSSFERRATNLEKAELRVTAECARVLEGIGPLDGSTIATRLGKLGEHISSLEDQMQRVETTCLVNVPSDLHRELEVMATHVQQSLDAVSAALKSTAEISDRMATVEPLVAESAEHVAKMNEHLEWYREQYKSTHQAMTDFMNQIPAIRQMNTRMESYVASISKLADLVATVETDLNSRIDSLESQRALAEEKIKDSSYRATKDLLDRVVALEQRAKPAEPAPTVVALTELSDSKPKPETPPSEPEPEREYEYVCHTVLTDGRPIYGIGDPTLANDGERTWSQIVDQVPALQHFATVYPGNMKFGTLTIAYRKPIPQMNFTKICDKFMADAAAKGIGVPPEVAHVFGTLVIIRHLNQNGSPVTAARRTAAVCEYLQPR